MDQEQGKVCLYNDESYKYVPSIYNINHILRYFTFINLAAESTTTRIYIFITIVMYLFYSLVSFKYWWVAFLKMAVFHRNV